MGALLLAIVVVLAAMLPRYVIPQVLFSTFFFITLKPRVEWYTKSMSLKYEPPRNRCTFL